MEELAARRKTQAPPPHVLFDELAAPRRTGARVWLRLHSHERWPEIVRAEAPRLVVWTSIFADRPADQIRFDIEPDGDGSRLRWSLLTDAPAPDPQALRSMSYRLNQLINGALREVFDQ